MKQVGRYRIVEEIGRGATGVVYKAADSRTNRMAAVKQIRFLPGQKIDAAGLEAVRALSAISHPHIATFYEALQADGQIFAAYEYVAGASLETMLRRLALPEKPVLLRCFEQAAQALDYADAKGFVHRDIRPSNILIAGIGGRQFTTKITDFGVSQLAPHEMTAGGSMVGTPFYLSPEEIQGTAVDGRSDQFSLAVVIYEVLTGAKPFTADNLQGIFYQICKQPAKRVNEINPALTGAVGEIVDRALAKNAAQRFFSCTEFVEALSGALREMPEWAAAVGEFTPEHAVSVGVPVGATATSLAAGEGVKRLPSLRRRTPGDEDEWDGERKKHSPLMLLAWMLVLSAVAIAITALWGEWNWHSLLPSQKPAQSSAATEATNNAPPQTTNNAPAQTSGNPPAQEQQPKPEEQKQAEGKASPPPVNTTPPASAPPATAEETAPAPAKTPAPAKQQESGPVPGATASIDLLSVPPGATMVVDGNQSTSCVAPCTMSLPNGRHTVAAQLNGYNVGRRVFNIPEDSSLVAALNKSTGTLVVTSTPPGSRIFIDGKLFGVTPATLHLSAGRHKLVLINGPMQHEETVEVEGGQLESRSIRW